MHKEDIYKLDEGHVSAFLVAANLIISEGVKRFRFAPELAPGAKTTPPLFI
jgi:hypothetical protein